MEAAIAFALSWVLHADPDSIAADQQKWDADQKAKEAAKTERAAEREKAKTEKAAVVAAATVGN